MHTSYAAAVYAIDFEGALQCSASQYACERDVQYACTPRTCCVAWPLGDMPHRAGCWRPAALVLLHAEIIVKLELLVYRRCIVKAAAADATAQTQGLLQDRACCTRV